MKSNGSDAVFTGTFSGDSQCSGGPQAGFGLSSGMPATSLTGSFAGLAFSKDKSNAAPDNPAATVTTSWRFSGSGDGNTITGVLTKARGLTVRP